MEFLGWGSTVGSCPRVLFIGIQQYFITKWLEYGKSPHSRRNSTEILGNITIFMQSSGI